MIWLLYDGSFEGMLTVVFETYEYKWKELHIRKEGITVPLLFTETKTVVTDEEKAKRVWKKLLDLIGSKGVQTVWAAWLSEKESIEDTILGVIRYAIDSKQNVLSDFAHPDVLQLQQTAKSVGREKHRMEAFVRFQLTKDGIYFSVINPDFNVLPLILPHFRDRYADQLWFIFDSRRSYGIYYDLEKAVFVDFIPNSLLSANGVSKEAFGEDEDLFQELWSDYFKSTNIQGRKNTKLHIQHVPKRYWKYLVEKKS
ncbi:TIGR03915 family putative DNA repair protein [uncultured Fluviicola sp.]|uniref:TIGR03915 family putative DNA repair protein n=1 Tax=uncultured Fluviicola sp. TaxID=463303 RepID=UPI0025CFC76B|nr:TIGR03915 family putative DNA repair protein [uncultured Fluviicola sp.]